MDINYLDSKGNKIDNFTQWDNNRQLEIIGVKEHTDIMIHFYNAISKRALVVVPKKELDKLVVKVPNLLLQQPVDLIVSIYITDLNESKTEYTFTIPVIKRAKPEDYNYEENIDYFNWVELSKQAQKQLEELQRLTKEIQDKYESGAFKGDKGDTGNGIKLIEKVSKIGLITTYRIIFTDGNSFSYEISDGYTPVKGKDYYTESEKKKLVNQVIEDSTNKFNTNAVEKTNAFNSNANAKLEEYNDFHIANLEEYSDNSVSKTNEFNQNANDKINELNTAGNKYDKQIKALQEKQNSTDDEVNNLTAEVSDNTEKIGLIKQEQVLQNKAIQKNVDDIIESNKNIASNSKRLKTLETNIFDSGVATGENINIKDSALAEFQEIKSSINKAQESTEGKSLLDPNTLIINRQGLKSEVTPRKRLRVFGTPEVKAIFLTENNTFLKDKIGYITATIKNIPDFVDIYAEIYLENSRRVMVINSKNQTYTINTNELKITVVAIYLNFNEIKPIDTELEIMFEEGQTPTKWEPYTGGIASPNPDYPQQINTIKENWETVSCGKNIFDKAKIREGFELIGNGTLSPNPNWFVSEPIEVIHNFNYIMTNPSSTQIEFLDEKGIFVGKVGTLIAFVPPKEASVMLLNGKLSDLDRIMLEIGTQPTPYEPYQSISTPNDLKGNEFLPGDNIIKKFNAEDGKYWAYLEKNMGKELIDLSQLTIFPYDSIDYASFKKNINSANYNNTEIIKILSNKAIFQATDGDWDNANKVGKLFVTAGVTLIWIGFPKGTTLDQMKTKLQGLEVVYQLKEELKQLIPLAPLDTMNMTYNPQTNLYSSIGNIKIEAKYYREFATTIRNMQVDNGKLQEQLNDMEKRIVALENKPVEVVEKVEEVTNA